MSDKDVDIKEEEEVKETAEENKEAEEEIKEEQTDDTVEAVEEEEADSEEELDSEDEETCSCQDKKLTFFRSFCASLIDEGVCLGAAYLLELLFNFIIKYIGYKVTDQLAIILIFFVTLKVLYTSIMESKFNGETIGKGLFNIKVIKK